MRIIKVLFLILLISSITCNSHKSCKNGHSSIQKYISSINFEKYYQGDYYETSTFEIIVMTSNGCLYSLPIYYLYPLSQLKEYKEYNFEDFVCKIINGKIFINEHEIKDRPDVYLLKIDKTLEKEIKVIGFFKVLDKYNIEKKEEGVYTFNDNNDYAADTFLLYFYKNDFLIQFSDVNGTYTAVKADSLIASPAPSHEQNETKVERKKENNKNDH